MKGNRFCDEQIIGVLRQQGEGAMTTEIVSTARDLGSQQSFFHPSHFHRTTPLT